MVRKTSRWTLFGAGLLVAFLAAGVVQAQGNREKSKLEAFRRELARKDFIVQDGSVAFPRIIDLCCQCKLPTCYGNNASSSYGFFALPPAPNQDHAVPNPYVEWYGPDHTLPAGWSYQWRMRPDEAAVFIGPTPPEVDYYGFTAYVYDRYVPGLPDPADCTWTGGPPRPQPASALHRFPVFASLADTINPLTINLAGGRQDPYEKNVAVMMAADRNTERKVRAALIAAGFPEDSINLLPVSPDIARLGLASEHDTLELVMRVAPIPGTDLTPYYSVPKTFLRLSPRTPVPAARLDPMPPPKLRVRGTGTTEVSLLPAVDALAQAIVARYPNHTATSVKMATIPDGYNCLENLQNCLGDNRDTVFIAPGYNTITGQTFQDLRLGSDEFFVAYGVIHPEMKKATYSNISVMGWGHKAAPVMVTNQDMAGSAQYFGSDSPAAGKIYAFKIARHGGCAGEADPRFCKEIECDCANGIAADEDIGLVFRAYVEPATAVGPSWGEVILDRILKFTPK